MKVLVIQPRLEKTIEQLENALRRNHPFVDAVIFPEGYLNEHVGEASALAMKYNTMLIGGYRRWHDNPKDRAIVINREGTVVLERIKYSPTSWTMEEGLNIGLILCDELVKQGIQGDITDPIDLTIHPIGVGMFSEEQFDEWINAAQQIAVQYQTMIIGTSHADGAFRGSDVSIPISYCIDPQGEAVCICKNDVRSWIVDTVTKEVTFLSE